MVGVARQIVSGIVLLLFATQAAAGSHYYTQVRESTASSLDEILPSAIRDAVLTTVKIFTTFIQGVQELVSQFVPKEILPHPYPSYQGQESPWSPSPNPNSGSEESEQQSSENLYGIAWTHDPLTVSIVSEKDVDPSMAELVVSAIRRWQDAIRAEAGLPSDLPHADPPFGAQISMDGTADILIIIKSDGSGEKLGETNITYSGRSIERVTIQLYAGNFNGYPLDRADVQNVAAHEFGHTLGLGHSNNPSDLMYYAYDSVRIRRVISPSSCDVEGLLVTYMNDGFALPNSPPRASNFSCP